MTGASAAAEEPHLEIDDRRAAALGGLSPDDYKLAFRNYPAGVSVITADPGDGPVGLTATSVFSISAEPPLFGFSLSAQSSSTASIQRAETVVVHLLTVGQFDIAKRFATHGIDRFADPDSWTRLPTGEPLIVGAHAWLRGRIIESIDAGGSTVVVAHAVESFADPVGEQAPLVYHNRTWHHLGEHSRLEA